MDRLTTTRDGLAGNRGFSSYATGFESPQTEVLNSLAAYEDTKLTPTEILVLIAENRQLKKEIKKTQDNCRDCPNRQTIIDIAMNRL